MWRGLIMSLQAMPGLENNFRSHPIWSTLHGLGTRNGSLEWNNVPLKQRCKYNILHKGIAVYTIYNVITVEWHIRVTLPAQRPVWMLQNLLLLCILYYLQEYWPPEINIYVDISSWKKPSLHAYQWDNTKSNLDVPVHDSIFVQVLESKQYLLRVSSYDLLNELVEIVTNKKITKVHWLIR
jgi:hypothetical protein